MENLEFIEVKVLLPNIIWDKFKEIKANSNIVNKNYSYSKKLSRFLLNYHNLLTNEKSKYIKDILDRKDVLFILNKYEKGFISKEDAIVELSKAIKTIK